MSTLALPWTLPHSGHCLTLQHSQEESGVSTGVPDPEPVLASRGLASTEKEVYFTTRRHHQRSLSPSGGCSPTPQPVPTCGGIFSSSHLPVHSFRFLQLPVSCQGACNGSSSLSASLGLELPRRLVRYASRFVCEGTAREH